MSHGDGGTAPESVYDRLGEFHDLFMDRSWERLRPVLAQAFGAFGPDRRIVDLGAGSGLGVLALAAETKTRISALEPSLVMRSTLTARVADRPELAARVTVLAGSVPDDLHALPDPIDGAVCANMLGHLGPEERHRLYGWIDHRLTADGVVVLTVHDEQTEQIEQGEQVLDSEPYEQRRKLGDYEYRAFYEQSSQRDQFSSRYEVWRDDALVRSEHYDGRWYAITYRDVVNDLRGLSLTASLHSPDIVLIRRP